MTRTQQMEEGKKRKNRIEKKEQSFVIFRFPKVKLLKRNETKKFRVKNDDIIDIIVKWQQNSHRNREKKGCV